MIFFKFLLTMGLTFNSQAATQRLAGIDAEFHPLILELLNKVASNTLPTAWDDSCSCKANENLNHQISNLGCQLSNSVIQKIKETQYSCLHICQPLTYYAHLPAREVNFSDPQSLPKMLEIFGASLSRDEIPGAFVNAETKALAQSITLKVFSEDRVQEISRRREALESIKRTCPNLDILSEALQEVETSEYKLASHRATPDQDPDLQFPQLTIKERRQLVLFLSAMTWRARGGGVYYKVPGLFATQKLRVKYIWNSYSTILNFLGAKDSLVRSASFSLYTRGFRGWNKFWDMGHNATYTLEEDFKLMTERGSFQVAGAVEAFKTHGYSTESLEFAGRQMGACYLYGWHGMKKPWPPWGASLKPPFIGLGGGPTSWGELCFGASLGLGLAETILGSKD